MKVTKKSVRLMKRDDPQKDPTKKRNIGGKTRVPPPPGLPDISKKQRVFHEQATLPPRLSDNSTRLWSTIKKKEEEDRIETWKSLWQTL